MLRDLCTVIGLVSLSSFLAFTGIVLWSSIVETCSRQHGRVHLCARHETIDAKSAYLAYRCTVCGRQRSIGIALHIGSNRRSRQA